ncbi:hypothetical protein ACE6H2_027178 [Prunus campanulata]
MNCPVLGLNFKSLALACDPSLVHVAMTIDSEYLRGTMAVVHSVLKHASCPENTFFHFIASDSTLDNPLNYARNYLADLLDPCVERVIYLDSDVIVVDDVQKLWKISLSGSRVIGAPEYCHANFTKYFSDGFWKDSELSKVFEGKKPCYFNTGVMLMDLVRWREGEYTKKIENWMEIQKERRIYELGSLLSPILLILLKYSAESRKSITQQISNLKFQYPHQISAPNS